MNYTVSGDVLKNFFSEKFIRKHQRWRPFLVTCNFTKKECHVRCFPVNFAKKKKKKKLSSFSIGHLQRIASEYSKS